MVTAVEIQEGVRRMFNRVAGEPTGRYRFEVGRALAREVGYPDGALNSLPPPAYESFTGVAYLHPHLRLHRGEHVLDLGSGGGLDAILASRAVLPGGSVTGLDMAEAMVSRARRLAASVGADHVRFRRGMAEAMPFADESVDVALANGFFNLCPDKGAVARELRRVLKKAGRAIVAEITFQNPLPSSELHTVDDWFR